MELFKIFGTIDLKDNDAMSKMEGVDKKGKGLSDTLKGGMKTAGKWGAVLGGAAVAGGGAMFAMAKKSADTTDEIDKLSQKIGISRQGFQEYSYILSQNGTDVSVLQRGFKTLGDRMDDAVEGSGKGAVAFEALGLTATDLNGNLKTQEQMFEESAKALMRMPEGAEKSALAFDLFGKAGQELMPLLNGTEEGMDELRQSAHDMGLVLSDDAVDAGANFTDTMDNIERSVGAITTNIGVAFMPILDEMLTWIIDHMPEIKKIMETVFEGIGKFVTIAVGIFKNNLMPIFQVVFEWTTKNWPAISKVIGIAMDLIGGVVKIGMDVFTGIMMPIFKVVFSLVKTLWPAISAVIKVAMLLISGLVKTNIKIVEVVFGGLSGLVTSVSGIFNKVKSALVDPIESAKNAISRIVEAIKGLFNFSFKWPKIPMPKFGINPSGWKAGDLLKGSMPKLSVNWNAKGGIFDKPTIFNTSAGLQGVGESGAEAIMPLSKLESMLNLNSDKGKEVVIHQHITSPKNLDARESQRLAYINLRNLAYQL